MVSRGSTAARERVSDRDRAVRNVVSGAAVLASPPRSGRSALPAGELQHLSHPTLPGFGFGIVGDRRVDFMRVVQRD